MIKLIHGPKGEGKTKELIQTANANAGGAKGLSVFITDTKRYMYDLSRGVRFIDATDWNIAGEDALCGFIKGIAASDSDYEYVYVDGIARICGKEIADLAGIFYMLDKISADNNIVITITCSCANEELPDFAKKYL
ncbi:MAG: hypothetical protein K2I30_00120 [Clostridia bacterium]|nr:hypothetical protein [Clostridia bacterium]